MPLDPSIIAPNAAVLQGIANPPNPIEMQARVQAIQNARLQSQSLQMGIQQQQREIEAQTLMGQAYSKGMKVNADGTTSFDPDAMSQVFTQGNRPDLIPGMVTSITQAEKTKADLKKAQADAIEAQNKVAQAHADHVGSMAVAIQQSGYTPDAVQAHVQDALRNGFITPQEAQQISAKVAQNPSPAGIKSWVDQIVAGNPAAQEFLAKQATAQSGTEKSKAEAAKATQDITDKQLQDSLNALSGAKSPQEFQGTLTALKARGIPDSVLQEFQGKTWTPAYGQLLANRALTEEQRQTLAGQEAARAQTKAHETVEEKQRGIELGLEARKTAAQEVQAKLAQSYIPTTPNAQNLTGEDYLKTLPAPAANQIRQIANGEQEAPSVASRNPVGAAVRAAVNQYDPTFNDNRRKTMIEYSTGAPGRRIGAIDTAIGHLDLLGEAATALRNGKFVPGNDVYNRFAAAFGAPEKSNVESIIQRVSGELNKATGSIGEGEQEAIKKNLNSGMSPEQLEGGVKTNIGLLGEAMDTEKEAYMRGTGFTKDSPKVQGLLTPRAQQALTKMGFDPVTMKPAQTQAPTTTGLPPRPASIPANATDAQYSAKQKAWRYTTDGGKTWQTPK